MVEFLHHQASSCCDWDRSSICDISWQSERGNWWLCGGHVWSNSNGWRISAMKDGFNEAIEIRFLEHQPETNGIFPTELPCIFRVALGYSKTWGLLSGVPYRKPFRYGSTSFGYIRSRSSYRPAIMVLVHSCPTISFHDCFYYSLLLLDFDFLLANYYYYYCYCYCISVYL